MRVPIVASVLSLVAAVPVHAQPAAPNVAPASTLASAEAEAAAAQVERPSFETVMRGAGNRARRAVAIGPVFGIGAAVPTAGDLDVPISAGLGISLFHVPVVPDRALVEDMIKSRVKVRLVERLQQAMAGSQERLARPEIETIARQVYQDVVAEVLGLHERRARTFEKPRAFLALEAVYAPRASDFGFRATARYGFGPISVGPTVLVAAEEGGAQAYIGGELAIAAMPNDGARANVYELALRGETGALRDGPDAVITLSLRALLDVI